MMKIINQSRSYLLFLVFTFLGFAVVLPMRWALQTQVWEYKPIFGFFYTGVLLDLRYLFLFFTILNLIFLLLRLTIKKESLFKKLVLSFLTFLFFALSIINFSSAQFFIERGVFASGFDIMNSSGDSQFFTSYMKIIFSAQYLFPFFIFSLPLFLFVLVYFYFHINELFKIRTALVNSFLLLLASVIAYNLYIISPRLFPLIVDRERVTTPYTILNLSSFNAKNRSVFKWLESFNSSSEELNLGMKYLGLKSWHEPLSDLLKQSPNAEIEKLSKDLAQGQENLSPIIWHIMIEGFRAHELQFMSPKAPAELAPFMNSLYKNQSLGSSHQVVAFTNMFQAGIRTAQGMSGALCGLGTLPNFLSITRDFGKTNLNCLPKIFNQLGFKTQFFNGVSPSFDKKNMFLSDQGTPFISSNDLRDQVDWDGWGIPDRIFYDYILKNHHPDEVPEYNVILTISHHGPFVRPPDVESDLEKRFKKVIATSQKTPESEDKNRILTYMYSDLAVSEFIEKILKSSVADRSFFIIQADHTSIGQDLWNSPGNDLEMYSKIPFIFIYPQKKIKDSLDRKNLKSRVMSQNDIPRFIMHSFSKLNVIRKKDLKQITHSLGGQTLAAAPPITKDAIVWGYNILARFYYVNQDGVVKEVESKQLKAPDFSQSPNPVVPGDKEILSALRSYFVKQKSN